MRWLRPPPSPPRKRPLGHIHSYYAFSSAGVPTFLSGGGGAIQEKLDGIARHYLRVRAEPGVGIDDVAVVRVD